MKKILSILLALIFVASSAVAASAALPADEITPYNLFQLPVVTSIEAELTGEDIFIWNGTPGFHDGNVMITLHFEEGEPQVLTRWNGWGTGDVWWSIGWNYNAAVGTVTFFYEDSNLWRAFSDANPDLSYPESRELFIATLPSATVDLSDVEFTQRYWQPSLLDRIVEWLFTSPWALPLRIVVYPFLVLFANVVMIPIGFIVFVPGWLW